MQHPYFGDLEFEEDGDFLEASVEQDGLRFVAELEGLEDAPSADDLDALADACKRSPGLVATVRTIVAENYEALHLLDGLAVWIEDQPEILKAINPDAKSLTDVTGTQIASKLSLSVVRYNLGAAEEEEEPYTLDLGFDFGPEVEMDYLIAVQLDEGFEVRNVALES